MPVACLVCVFRAANLAPVPLGMNVQFPPGSPVLLTRVGGCPKWAVRTSFACCSGFGGGGRRRRRQFVIMWHTSGGQPFFCSGFWDGLWKERKIWKFIFPELASRNYILLIPLLGEWLNYSFNYSLNMSDEVGEGCANGKGNLCCNKMSNIYVMDGGLYM
jgi:hypothetical protein